jgi:hypothetical protein
MLKVVGRSSAPDLIFHAAFEDGGNVPIRHFHTGVLAVGNRSSQNCFRTAMVVRCQS